MEILLRQARIIDPSSSFHQQQADIFIQDGIIKKIGTLSKSGADLKEIHGVHVSPGWVDLFAQFGDPGYEYRETLATGSEAAASGGYTDVLILPNTAPVLHNKSGIEYIVQRSRGLPVSIHPIGAITKNAEGKELAEMYDMHQSGAAAFSDGIQTIQSAGLLLKALQYLKAIAKTVIQLPNDRSVNPSGLMHEGVVSTRLGLPGMPAIAEDLMIVRDLELVKYTGSKLHLTGISTAGAVALIRLAKAEGVAVSCSVTPYHLWFTDEDLKAYDTNLKLTPPVRTEKDRAALRAAVLDGTIDCIATHHMPLDTDHKVVEFEYALPGMTGLETSYGIVRTCMPELSEERLAALFSTAARNLFDLQAVTIQEGQPASLTLFDPQATWKVPAGRSRSRNTPFTGIELKGKPIGIINKDKLFLNEL
ncbi:MAG TPA: dihydroorotase [Flavisolibacter sp.]|nr:dihydroorotase [Flavisolibacter sp.]